MPKSKFKIRHVFVGLLLIFALYFFSKQPSHDRDWTRDQAVLPYAEINGPEVTIFNIRDIDYRSVDDYDLAYYDGVFDLGNMVSVDS